MSEDASEDKSPEKAQAAQEAEKKIKSALREILDEAGYNRMMNISLANKALYAATIKYLLGASRRVERKLTEAEVVAILRSIKSQTETQTKITFHSK